MKRKLNIVIGKVSNYDKTKHHQISNKKHTLRHSEVEKLKNKKTRHKWISDLTPLLLPIQPPVSVEKRPCKTRQCA